MELHTLNVKKREELGKASVGRLRKTGHVPCTLYSAASDPVNLKFNLREFVKLMHTYRSEYVVMMIEVENDTALNTAVMVKNIDYHPVRDTVMHADFMRISLEQRITVPVPTTLVGHSVGIVAGGVLDHQMREIEIECLVTDIPEVFQIDISELGIGDNLQVKDIVISDNIKVISDESLIVVAVHQPRAIEEAEVEGEEGEDGAEEAEKGDDEKAEDN